jgi:hypothetical protein
MLQRVGILSSPRLSVKSITSLPLLHQLFRILPRVGMIKDLPNLFQSKALGFDDEKVNDDQLEDVPEQEDEIDWKK